MHDNQPGRQRWPEGRPGARFVVHLPVAAGDLPSAVRLARVLAHRAATLPGAEPGETTVSRADDLDVQHRVFCHLPLAWRRRCGLPAGHHGSCQATARSS